MGSIKDNLVGIHNKFSKEIKQLESDLRGESDFMGSIESALTRLTQLKSQVATIDALLVVAAPVPEMMPTRTEQMLTTVTENAKAKVKAALERIIKWRATRFDDACAKLEAIEGLCGTFAGIDSLELTNICLNLRERVKAGDKRVSVPCGVCSATVEFDALVKLGIAHTPIRQAMLGQTPVAAVTLVEVEGAHPLKETPLRDVVCSGCATRRVLNDAVQGRRADDEWDGPRARGGRR